MVLIVIVSLIAYYRIKLQINLGPIFDVFDLMSNAALFAGKGIGFTDLTRPPFLSLLTSIFFFFDGLVIWPIFVVDGSLYVFGCVGLYLFLKERFDSLTSFIGSLLFATFPLVLTYAGVGYNDVSGVSMAIWAIYLTYLAVNKNSKYFFLSFPMALLAFLTRYNMALIIFPILFYILLNRSKIKSSKNIFIGLLLSLLFILPILVFFNAKFGNPISPFLSFFQTSEGSGFTEHFAYDPDLLYFLKNMPFYIGPQTFFIFVFIVAGFAVYLLKRWKKIRSRLKSMFLNLKSIRMNFKLLIIFIIIFTFVLTFAKVNYLFSEVIFFALAYLIYAISRDMGIDLDMDLLFFAWFMVFFIFHSVYVAKVPRYFITMYPPLAYFLVRGVHWAAGELKVKFKGKNITTYFIASILMVIILLSVFMQFSNIEKSNRDNLIFNEEAREASYWLINYDQDYKSKVIYADFWSYFAWYLQMDVGKMPIFRNNQTLYVGARDYNYTEADKLAFNRKLEESRPDYYISAWKGMNFTSYKSIHKFGDITIFKRIRN